MSGRTIGTIGGAIVGAVLAWFSGGTINPYNGAMLGAAIGGAVGGVLDPPKGPHYVGPRLDDLSQQTATYGAFIPRVYSKIAVFGNVFWIENNKLKEVSSTQTQSSKGAPPEASSTTYKYYATFAISLSEGLDPALYGAGSELIMTKVWINGKLFYNRYSSDAETVLTSQGRETQFKFYSGTEDQMPEPRMEADLGIENCPAYRGIAYLVIYDMDVGPYGNSIAGAQIKVELLANGEFIWDSEVGNEFTLAAGGGTNLRGVAVGNYLYVTDSIANRLITVDATDPDAMSVLSSLACAAGPIQIRIDDAGFVYVLGFTGTSNLQKWSISNPVLPVLVSSTGTLGGGCRSFTIQGNYAYVGNDGTNALLIIDTTSMSIISNTAIGNNPLAPVLNGDVLYIGCQEGLGTSIKIIDVSNKVSPALINSTNYAITPVWDMSYKDGYLFTSAGSKEIIVVDVNNPATQSIVFSVTGGAEYHTGNIISENHLFSLKSNGLLYWYNISNPLSPVLAGSVFVTTQQADGLVKNGEYYFAFSSSSGPIHRTVTPTLVAKVLSEVSVQLSDIVEAECLRSKLLTSGDLDTTLLTSTVRGYKVSSVGSVRGAIEPLQAAWPFDVIHDGYKIKYIPRGGANVATISYDKLDARAYGSEMGIKITNSREMDSVLPAKVSVKYLGINRAYDINEQYYERINTESVNFITLDLPIVFTDNEAAGKAQTLTNLYWMERYDLNFKLPPEYLHLQPSDVITINAPGASYNLRLKQINYTQDGRLECTAKYNRSAIYTPSAIVDETPGDDETLSPPGVTVYTMLDIPLLQDVYNQPGFPVAMTGTKKGWPGGVLAKSTDGGVSYATVGAVPSPGTTMGVATNTLIAWTQPTIDKASVLNVTLTQGSLSSVTELQMLNGSNYFAYGAHGRWEIIAAQNCVLQLDGSYQLTDFLRGRYGTEIYSGTHVANDSIIYLASASMMFVPLNNADIGLSRDYKAVNFQSTLDTATAVPFIYAGVNLECLSPVYLNGNIHPSTNDWTLTWVRRSRTDGEWRDLVDAGLGEATESYEIEIFSNNTFTTVLRTLTATTQTSAYTSAQQVTDFGSNQATLYVRIYQLSATVGRGYPLQSSITR